MDIDSLILGAHNFLVKQSLSSEALSPHAPNPKAKQDERDAFVVGKSKRCGTIWGLGLGPNF
jgi:hypothetical protein